MGKSRSVSDGGVVTLLAISRNRVESRALGSVRGAGPVVVQLG